MNKSNLKIISGGQTGADLAGLWVARLFGLTTGGMAPKGWRTQLGSMHELGELFDLTESKSSYHGRTLENCEASDLTIIFASNIKSPGTKLTLHHCITNGIRCRVFSFQEGPDLSLIIDSTADSVYALIKQKLAMFGDAPFVINVAGNSTSTSASTFSFTFFVLCKVFEKLLDEKSPLLEKYNVRKVEAMLRDCYDRAVYESLHNIVRSSN